MFFLPLNFSPLLQIFLPLSFPPHSRRSSSNSATFSSAPIFAVLSQDPLLALLSSYIVSSQPHNTSSNHSTTNMIKTPLLIMVNTICSHEGCQRKPMKHGNGTCHLHGVRRKCSFPQCLNNARRAGVCVQHGSIKKQCSENGCTNNAVRKGVCINHRAMHYCTVIDCGKALFQTGKCRHHSRFSLAASSIDMCHVGLHAPIMDIPDIALEVIQ